MTREDIVKEARQLPLAERRAAVEEITSSIREEIEANGSSTQDERHSKNESSFEEKLAAFHRLHGMLKTDAPPPTDEELKEDYINYLAEKYS
ncbi:MAG: hypothetical protein DMF74_05505 [Acidobacteria bacterium]|nr:MAG: hypothetical protein DMF74_05505 [Acidobacteriota bacterium]